MMKLLLVKIYSSMSFMIYYTLIKLIGVIVLANCKKCGIDTKEYDENCKFCRNRKKKKENYIKNKIIGLCSICGKNKARENKNSCEQCSNKLKDGMKLKMRERNEELKKKNMCIACGQVKSIEGKNYCEKCIIIRRERAKERQDKLREEGICLHCGKSKDLYGNVICKECMSKQLERDVKNKGDK